MNTGSRARAAPPLGARDNAGHGRRRGRDRPRRHVGQPCPTLDRVPGRARARYGASSTPSATPTPQRGVLDLPAEEVAALGIDSRPPVGAKALAKAAESAAAVQPYSLGSSTSTCSARNTRRRAVTPRSSPGPDPGRLGGREPGGGVRRERGRDAGGPGRPARRDRTRHGGSSSRSTRASKPRQGHPPVADVGHHGLDPDVEVVDHHPVHGLTRPPADRPAAEPSATGREIYVMNVHNSPHDAQGREESATGPRRSRSPP